MNLKAVVVSSLLVMNACAMFSNTVKPDVVQNKAGSDFTCDAAQVTVTKVDGTSWKATGCGKVASYKCWTSVGMGAGTCMREGDVPAAAAP